MKYILYIMMTFGQGEVQAPLLIRGPAFDTQKACEAQIETLRFQSKLPVINAGAICEKEKQA